jgi:Holliday junction resolvase YEN1
LAKLPLLPLFVFDGRDRPKVKRGSKMGKAGSHNLTDGMKKLLDIFGMEWRMVSTV